MPHDEVPAGTESAPVLLYDGTCGFCAASVRFVLGRERLHTLRFAALESEAGREVRARHPELAGVDSMVWVDAPGGPEERVLVRSEAVLRIARYLGGPWRVAAIGRVLPRPLRDTAYDLVARHRHKIFGEQAECYLPPPDVRPRFLENFEGHRELPSVLP